MQNNKKIFSDFETLYKKWAIQTTPFAVYSLFSKNYKLYTYLINSPQYPYGIKLRFTASKKGKINSAMFSYLQKNLEGDQNSYIIYGWEFRGKNKVPELMQVRCEMKADEAILKVLEEIPIRSADLFAKFESEVLDELNIMVPTISLPTIEGKIFDIHTGNIE